MSQLRRSELAPYGLRLGSVAEIYDPRTEKFTAASPMNDSRFMPDEAVQLTSGKLLIAGG